MGTPFAPRRLFHLGFLESRESGISAPLAAACAPMKTWLGSRIKKAGHSERSVGVGFGGGPTRSEEPRGMFPRLPVLAEYLFRTHGILRFRAAPPSPSRRSTQDDLAF